VAGPLVCALFAALVLVTLGWRAVVGAGLGLVLGLLLAGGDRRADRSR
jgi:hypothetical protein